MDCIVNVTQNWGIGKDGDLLVSIPTDLRRFRALTTGKTVIYGRKTLLTFPHACPLPNRENWILSATPGFSVPCACAGAGDAGRGSARAAHRKGRCGRPARACGAV